MMGKAARNRTRRRNQAEQEQQREAARDAVGELLQLEDLAAFTDMLEQNPELLGATAIEELRRVAQSPGYGPLIARVLHLLEGARSDPHAAWEAFSRARELSDAAGRDLEVLQDEIDVARATGKLPHALELIEQALKLANEIGYGLSVCDLLTKRGLLLVELNADQRASEVDAALIAFEEALEIAVPGEQAARILMLRGLAYSERVNGDPAENTDRAIVSVRDGLTQLEGSENQELRAMMQTNLAVAMIRSGRDRAGAARAAANLCRQALTYRSTERDPHDWAYSQINLGYALQTLAELGEGEPNEARTAYTEVLAHGDLITDTALLGSAHHALGRLELHAAHNTPEDIAQAHGTGELEELYDDTAALRSAREHLQAALDLTPKAPDPLRYARILDDLSNALDQLGQEDEALARAQEALELVTPGSAPVVSKDVGWRVGALLGKRGDWDSAATAFRAALAGAELTLNARIDTTFREREIQSAGNLHRWAAYALAKAGDVEGAALTLDGGRARELQRRLGLPGSDEVALAQVPAELREHYEAALGAFVASPIDGTDTIASRRLGETIAAIRELPGLSRFRTGPQWDEIIGAIEPGWPLVYVNPTPLGTLVLLLCERDGEVSAEVEFIEVTSTEVFMHLAVGGGDLDAATVTAGGSYLIGASAQGLPDHDLAGDLDQLLPWLGGTIAGPLADLLADAAATGATLVLCGMLGSAPLHAASLGSSGEVLADKLELRYAPSGAVCAAAIARAGAAGQRPRRLVALADPRGDLPAACPEVQEIAALFDTGASTYAVGAAATRRFLKQHAAQASHLHLACHARGGLFDASEAAIVLASGPLAATELPALAELSARLVVVSACQSAQSTIAGLPHEELSIATAMLAAGGACAIASLWPVDDLATALLMTRLYQELLVGESAPPPALRAAQLWLRDLSDDEEQRFLDRHPQLAAEYARRVAAGDLPGRRGGEFASGPPGAGRPYEHPAFWAPFIAVGV
jgi:CHAT domain-containing protein/tetratricopeptide (TPR) repeat protein